MSLRSFILNALYPAIRLVGEIHVGPRTRKINFEAASKIAAQLKDGDVVCTYAQGELTNLFIGGEFKHAGIFVDGKIVECTRKGVHETHVMDYLMTKDKVTVRRPSFFIDLFVLKARIKVYLFTPYDWLFEPGIKAFTCAELVVHLLADAAGKDIPFTTRKIFGVQTVHPQDFANATDKFRRIF